MVNNVWKLAEATESKLCPYKKQKGGREFDAREGDCECMSSSLQTLSASLSYLAHI